MASDERYPRTGTPATINFDQESHSWEASTADGTFLLASIVESSDDAIITKTSKGIITSWNSGAERIYGFSAAEVLGKPVSILIPSGPERRGARASWIASSAERASTITRPCGEGKTACSFTCP